MSGVSLFANRVGIFCRLAIITLKRILVVLCVVAVGATSGAMAAGLQDYKLSEGDVLEFDYLDDLELPRQLTIGSGGNIQVPILGTAKVVGLTLEAANDLVRKQLIDRELLNNPAFTLSVFTYRPVYVIGDVRTPGTYPFHAGLTVEQSIGLAGGMMPVESTAESRMVTRSRLQGDLYGTDSEITRQAVWAARLAAELAGRNRIAMTDLPEKSKLYLEDSSIDEFIAIENRILEANINAVESQKSILQANIAATRNQLEIFDKLAKNQETAVQFTRDERDRVNKLLKSGLKTAGELADVQRQLTSDEGRLLQILADKGSAVVRNSALQKELATILDGGKKDALIALQERNAALTLLLAKRRATEEQLQLVTNWASTEAENTQKSIVQYKIRARGDQQTNDQTVSANSELLPGDVLIVSIKQPEPPNAKSTAMP